MSINAISNNNALLNAPIPEGIDDAVGVPDRNWYVAIVTSRHEKVVAERLNEINVENYVAIQREPRLWRNGKRKIVDRVVIPSTVFVKCTEFERRKTIVNLPYISRFMVNRTAYTGGLNKPVAVIGEAEMQTLKFMLGHAEHPVGFNPTIFKVHDNVRVMRGRLKGLEGEIISNPDGSHSLVVGLPLLGGATVFIDPADVEKL